MRTTASQVGHSKPVLASCTKMEIYARAVNSKSKQGKEARILVHSHNPSTKYCSMADGISFDVSLSLNCTDFYKREGGA